MGLSGLEKGEKVDPVASQTLPAAAPLEDALEELASENLALKARLKSVEGSEGQLKLAVRQLEEAGKQCDADRGDLVRDNSLLREKVVRSDRESLQIIPPPLINQSMEVG